MLAAPGAAGYPGTRRERGARTRVGIGLRLLSGPTTEPFRNNGNRNWRRLASCDSAAPLRLLPPNTRSEVAAAVTLALGADSTPALAGVGNYWSPCVTIRCLRRAPLQVSGNKYTNKAIANEKLDAGRK